MVNYKKFIIPVIASGLLIAHMPAHAISDYGIVSSIQQYGNQLLQPFFKSNLWTTINQSPIYNALSAERNKKAAAVVGITGMGIFAGYKYYSLYTKNAQLLLEKNDANNANNELKLKLENNNKTNERLSNQINDLEKKLAHERDILDSTENILTIATDELKEEQKNKTQFKNDFAYSFGTWLCNNLGNTDVRRYEDKDITENTHQKIDVLRKKTFEALTLASRHLANKGIKERTAYLELDNEGHGKHIANQRERGIEREKEIGRLNKENERLHGELKKRNGAMKRSSSFDNLRNKDATVDFLAQFFPVVEEKKANQVNGTELNVNNIPMSISSDFTKIYHDLDSNEEARVKIYDESKDILSEENS